MKQAGIKPVLAVLHIGDMKGIRWAWFMGVWPRHPYVTLKYPNPILTFLTLHLVSFQETLCVEITHIIIKRMTAARSSTKHPLDLVRLREAREVVR